MSPASRLLLAFVASMSLAIAGCGDDGDAPAEAQPAQDDVAFVSDSGMDVPVHPLAEPLGPISTKDGVTARSYELRNTTAAQLFDWYGERLTGWAPTAEPAATGGSSSASTRAIWTNDGYRLVVTVSPAPTIEGEEPRAQYSLSLEPIR